VRGSAFAALLVGLALVATACGHTDAPAAKLGPAKVSAVQGLPVPTVAKLEVPKAESKADRAHNRSYVLPPGVTINELNDWYKAQLVPGRPNGWTPCLHLPPKHSPETVRFWKRGSSVLALATLPLGHGQVGVFISEQHRPESAIRSC
jgi:hypothetical protein